MKHLIFLLFMVCLIVCKGLTQIIPLDGQRYQDSLTTRLKESLSDSDRAFTNFLLSDYWFDKDSVQSKKYLEQGHRFAIHSRFMQALFFYFLASYLYDKDSKKSEQIYYKADSLLSEFTSQQANLYRAFLWGNIATLEQKLDKNVSYLDIQLQKALPFAKASANATQLAKVYSDISLVFNNLDELDKTVYYDSIAITTVDTIKDKANQRVMNVYLMAARNSLYLHHYQKAKALLDKSYAILTPFQDNTYFLEYYELQGKYYTDLKEYGSALNVLDKGIDLAMRIGDDFRKTLIQFQKYRVYAFQKDYKEALRMLFVILRYTDISLSANRLILYKEVANTYESLGDYKNGMVWLRKMAELSDSLAQANITNNINDLEAKYQNSEKEKKILALQTQQTKAALISQKQQSTNRLLLLGCAFLLAIVGGSIYYYRKLTHEKEVNYVQQLKQVEQLHTLGIAQAMLAGEERERSRVARELHDGLGGMLAGVKLNLSSMEQENEAIDGVDANQGKLEENMEQTLGKVIGQLDGSITELRRIARNMMPESLLKLGLEKALKDLCDYYTGAKCQVHFQGMDIAKDVPLINQVYIYRIIQELVSNAIRHGAARSIFVQCSQNDALFLITAEDDGKGFDTNILAQQKGLGWHNIQTRVAFLKGKLDIQSEIGKGTTINIELDGYAG